MTGPLHGIRVLDFTHHVQGPSGTRVLSDMGAEIWKVEPIDVGDANRHGYISPDGYAKRFECFNRGKKSIALDIRTDEGREIALRLGEMVDVVAENFRPGVMDRLGLGYEDFKARNDDIILASASAFGSEGPLGKRPGQDAAAQAMGGVMVMQAYGPDMEPRTMPGTFADLIGSTQFATAILGAILCRNRTGKGQKVATSLYGSQIYLQSYYVDTYLYDGVQHHEKRRRMPTFSFYQGSDDLWFVFAANEQKSFDKLCVVLDTLYLLTDPRWTDVEKRQDDKDYDKANTLKRRTSTDLELELEMLFRKQPRDYWLSEMTAVDIACAPVNSYADLEVEPQALENGYIVEVEHPKYGKHKTHGAPWLFSETPATIAGFAPELGANTDSVLAEAGYTGEQIAEWRKARVVQSAE